MADPNPLRAGRRLTDPMVAGHDAPIRSNLPVPVGPARTHEKTVGGQAGPVEAQIIGQDGQKRGLRGGKPVLDHARSAYLGAEWSGPADRRPPKGMLTKTKV